MLYALDIETTGLDPFKDNLLLIGIYSEKTGYIGFNSMKAFQIWNEPSHQFVMHGGKFDVNFLRRKGLDIRAQFQFDTHSIASILKPRPAALGLETLAKIYLGFEKYKLDRTKMGEHSFQDLLAYNEKDCRYTYDLFSKFIELLDPKDFSFVDRWLMPVTKLTLDMEFNGVQIDIDALTLFAEKTKKELEAARAELTALTEDARAAWQKKLEGELEAYYKQLCQLAMLKSKDPIKCAARYKKLHDTAKPKIEPFNFGSQKQLKWLLGEFYGIDLFNKRSEKETTDEAMLKEYEAEFPVCRALLRFRELDKLAGTSLPALTSHLGPDGRVHARFNVGGTRTGRLSSSNPNMQQIPRGPLRSCIVAAPGHKLFTADYAQIEVRIMAHLAKEEELINAFKEKIDPYSIIAARLFQLDCDVRDLKQRFPKERDCAKTAGLSILYGTGAAKLKETIQKTLGRDLTLKTCKDYIEAYREGFKAISRYKDTLEKMCANQNKVYNLLGRPFYIESNEDLYMLCLNTMVQGSSSDLVAYAFTKIYERFPFVKPVMMIHDEMVIEIPEEKITGDFISEISYIATVRMQKELSLRVPLKIEYNIAREWSKP